MVLGLWQFSFKNSQATKMLLILKVIKSDPKWYSSYYFTKVESKSLIHSVARPKNGETENSETNFDNKSKWKSISSTKSFVSQFKWANWKLLFNLQRDRTYNNFNKKIKLNGLTIGRSKSINWDKLLRKNIFFPCYMMRIKVQKVFALK